MQCFLGVNRYTPKPGIEGEVTCVPPFIIVPDSVGGYSLFVSFVCLFVCLSVCLSVCVHDNSKNNGSIDVKLEHIVVYENSSDEFDIGHCPIKVKVTEVEIKYVC